MLGNPWKPHLALQRLMNAKLFTHQSWTVPYQSPGNKPFASHALHGNRSVLHIINVKYGQLK